MGKAASNRKKKVVKEQQASPSSSPEENDSALETPEDSRRCSGRKRKMTDDNVSVSQTDDQSSTPKQNGLRATKTKPTTSADAGKSLRVASGKMRAISRLSIIDHDEVILDVVNEGLFPTKDIEFKEFDMCILGILGIQPKLGLSQPDKEKWDDALHQIISLRSIYNERLRTGIEVPGTTADKSVQTFRQAGSVSTRVTFEEIPESITAALETVVGSPNETVKEDKATSTSNLIGNDGNQKISVAAEDTSESTSNLFSHPSTSGTTILNSEQSSERLENEDYNAFVSHQTKAFLDDIDDDCSSQNHTVNTRITRSVSEKVGSSSTQASSSSRKRRQSSTNVREHVQANKIPGDKSTCSTSAHSSLSKVYSTRLRKRMSSESIIKGQGHVKPKTPAMEEPIQNHLNSGNETPSTSRKTRSKNPEDSTSRSDGNHMLPNLPTLYIKRKIRIMKGRLRYLTEDEFLTSVAESFTNAVIAIHGPSGMGKTTFLAQIGRKIRRAFPGRKLFYLEMKSVVDAVKAERKHSDKDSATWTALRCLTREIDLGNVNINLKTTNCSMMKTELFLDGFDDVQLCDWGVVCEILRCISGSFHSTGIRMWIATVPHNLKIEHEQALRNAERYSLEPLDYASQVEIIASYLKMHTLQDKTRFVEKCVSDCDLELGTPLQCLLVGAACLKQKQWDSKNSPLSMSENILDIDKEETYLLDAASRRSFHTLELILSLNKFSINSKDENGDSPLFLSAYAKGNVDCLLKLKFLIAKGANLAYLNNDNDNLIIYAAKYASADVLQYILNLNKFEINCVDSFGSTPLFCSVDARDNIDCLPKLKLLIKHKANLNQLDNGNYNLLMYAARFSTADVFEYIFSMGQFNVNSKDDEGDTSLLLSVFQYEGIDCLKKLESVIGHGGNLDHVNNNGANLLHYAAQYASPDVLKYVINLGRFDINSRDKFGNTALDYARIELEGVDYHIALTNVDKKAKEKLLIERGCIGRIEE